MAVIPKEKCVIMEQLWTVNYDSFSTARLYFADKIYQTVSQIHGVHIRNCIKGHNNNAYKEGRI